VQNQVDHKLAEARAGMLNDLLEEIKKQVAAVEATIAASAAKLVEKDLVQQMTYTRDNVTKQMAETEMALVSRMNGVESSMDAVSGRVTDVETKMAAMQQEIEGVKSSKELCEKVAVLTLAMEEEKVKTAAAESRVAALEKKISTQRDRITKADKKHSEDIAAMKAEFVQLFNGLKDGMADLRKENCELKLVSGDAYRFGGEALRTQIAMLRAAGISQGTVDLPQSYPAPDWLVHPKFEVNSPTVRASTVSIETAPAHTPFSQMIDPNK